MNESKVNSVKIPRRALLKIGAMGTAAVAVASASSIVVPELRRKGLYSANGLFDATSIALASKIYDETFPTSPLILNPFQDPLNVPKALRPVPKDSFTNWANPPGPGYGQQSSYGNQAHQKSCASTSGPHQRSTSRSAARRLHGDRLVGHAAHHSHHQLTVGDGGLDGSAVPIRHVDFALVAPVLPLVHEVLARAGAA